MFLQSRPSHPPLKTIFKLSGFLGAPLGILNFKPLLDPGSDFASETKTAAAAVVGAKRPLSNRFRSETVANS
jgi:hypothetical protein